MCDLSILLIGNILSEIGVSLFLALLVAELGQEE